MSTELVKVERLQTAEIISTAKAFFESGMFADIKSAAQAVVKIMAGQELGLPPFASMSGIHIIQGKPTIGAGLIASRVKGSGKYDYEVIEQTEKNCSIDFYQGKKKIGNSSFSAADAQKAGTKNMDKFPKNMLFARAISNGVKWYAPDVFAGPVYTPEEMGSEVTEDVNHEVVPPHVQQKIKDQESEPIPVVIHDQVKPAISDRQFEKLNERLMNSKDSEAGLELLNKAKQSFTFTDEQASTLVDAVSLLTAPV